jgi:hypothetical protein
MTDAISWRNPKVLRVLLLVFIAGGLSGAVAFRVARLALRREPPAVAAGPTLRDKEQAMALLKQELNLTPDQSERVSIIIDDYKRYYGNIQDQVEEVRATGKNKILEVLDPQQRTKFEKLAERLK